MKNKLKKLAKFQRKFAKPEPGSKRREKRRLRIAKLHSKIKDIRTDFLHKLSTDLVKKYVLSIALIASYLQYRVSCLLFFILHFVVRNVG